MLSEGLGVASSILNNTKTINIFADSIMLTVERYDIITDNMIETDDIAACYLLYRFPSNCSVDNGSTVMNSLSYVRPIITQRARSK
jgi:hypothetical protein